MDLLGALFPLSLVHYIMDRLLIGLGVSLLFVLTSLIGGMSKHFSLIIFVTYDKIQQ